MLVVLTVANLAPHNHSLEGASTPETALPGALPRFASGLGALGLVVWRRRKKKAPAVAF